MASNINSLSNIPEENKTFYDRTLLSRLIPSLVFMQYGQKKTVPKNEGDTVNFRRFQKLDAVTEPLVEGVTPQGNNISVMTITATIEGYGDWVLLTDKIDMMGIDPVVTETLEVQGEQAGESLDKVVRDVVAEGTNVYYVGGHTERGDVESGDTISGSDMRRIRQLMARNNVKKIEGSPKAWIGIIHPDVAHDIMGDNNWEDVHKYTDPSNMIEGEIGKLYGVRYVETTLAPVFEGEGGGGTDVYGTIIIGKDAYGVPDIDGSSKPETIVKGLGEGGTSDPLNQRSTVGWKAYLATSRLEELCILRVESAASVGSL